MDTNPSYFQNDGGYRGTSAGALPPSDMSNYDDCARRPAENMTWFDMLRFCNALSKLVNLDTCYSGPDIFEKAIDYTKKGFRLPTSAEWEYVYRAGTTTRFYWGDTINLNYMWCGLNTLDSGVTSPEYGTHIVGTKLPNNWGLYDMAGNLVELCNNTKGYELDTLPRVDPIQSDAWDSLSTSRLKVQRGGSWSSPNISTKCSAHYINTSHQWTTHHDNAAGFRFMIVK
jgi:formylglycine-generating enzyme required for sulfatase activity